MIFHVFSLKNHWFFVENQWKIMDFRDFPMFLGKSGKYKIHPPKLCAGIVQCGSLKTTSMPAASVIEKQSQVASVAHAEQTPRHCADWKEERGRRAHNFGGWISYFPDFRRILGKSRKPIILNEYEYHDEPTSQPASAPLFPRSAGRFPAAPAATRAASSAGADDLMVF